MFFKPAGPNSIHLEGWKLLEKEVHDSDFRGLNPESCHLGWLSQPNLYQVQRVWAQTSSSAKEQPISRRNNWLPDLRCDDILIQVLAASLLPCSSPLKAKQSIAFCRRFNLKILQKKAHDRSRVKVGATGLTEQSQVHLKVNTTTVNYKSIKFCWI